MATEDRIVRVPLPDDLIRQVDQLVDRGRGGFRSREELIREAVHQMAVELQHEPADPPPPSTFRLERSRPSRQMPLSDEMEWSLPGSLFARGATFEDAPHQQRPRDEDLSFTTLDFRRPAATAPHPKDGAVRQEPLFGLHNRDFPTLWAATKLAELADDDLIQESRFRAEILPLAWEMGARIVAFDPRHARRLAASFPTNRDKKQGAEDAFWTFAIGSSGAGGRGAVELAGPFYLWGIAGIERKDGHTLVGLTEDGIELLSKLQGLQLGMRSEVHPYASRFFEHLRIHARPDWWGFETVVRLVGPHGTKRTQLVEGFRGALQESFPPPDQWSEVKAATNASGYVARAREWGLLYDRLYKGQYLLTDFGETLLATL